MLRLLGYHTGEGEWAPGYIFPALLLHQCGNQEWPLLGRGAAAPLLKQLVRQAEGKPPGGSPQSDHPWYLSGARPPLQTLVFNPSACGSQKERHSEDSNGVPEATQDSM